MSVRVPPTPSRSREATVQLLPQGPAAFSLHLVLEEDGAQEGRFVQLPGAVAGARAFAAEVRSASGAVLEQAVLELPPERAQVEDDGAADTLPTNAEEERQWQATRDDLDRLRERDDYFPLLLLPPADGEEAAALLPPTVYSPESRTLEPIPCPACQEPLRTCRDDQRLAAAQLPLYSSTRQRFLHCPACDPEAGTRFWTHQAKVPEELRAKGVESVDELRKAGKASWHVFNPHDSPYLVVRSYGLPPVSDSFDELVDRLGRRPVAGVSGDADFLFAVEGSGLDAVEALTLKLCVFAQVVDALRAFYRRLGLPHLDLHPGQLVVEPGRSGAGLPSLWTFRLRLKGTSSARRKVLGPELAVNLPPAVPRVPFCSPAVQAAFLAQGRRGDFIVKKLVEEPGKGKAKSPGWRLEGELADPDGVYPMPGLRDLVRLSWPGQVLGGENSTTLARLDPRKPTSAAHLALSTEPLSLSEANVERLKQSRGLRIADVGYRVFTHLGVADDIYSLGVLLLRLLLVHDGQSLGDLEGILDLVPRTASEEEALEMALGTAFSNFPETLAKNNVFYPADDRLPSRPNAIPEEIWREVLLLAFRLIARGPDLGLDADDTIDEHMPVRHLDHVQQRVDGLVRQLKAVLFRRQPTHVEIHSVIAEMLAELG